MCVYFLLNEFDSAIKVGYSSRPKYRTIQISRVYSKPIKLLGYIALMVREMDRI